MYRSHISDGGISVSDQNIKIRALKVLGEICNENVSAEDKQWLEELLISDSSIQDLCIAM